MTNPLHYSFVLLGNFQTFSEILQLCGIISDLIGEYEEYF